MGEGDLQGNEERRYIRPGEMRWPGDDNQGVKPLNDSVAPEVESIYGRSGIQNHPVKPPIRFMEGEQDPLIPNTKGRVWEEVDPQTGRRRKVHGTLHMQLPAPMAQDQSRTMEDNIRAAEERQRRGNSPTGPTPDDIARKHAENRQEAIRQETRIRQYTDWAPNVVGNDWMGGAGYAAAVLLFGRGKTVAETAARVANGFGWGCAATGAMQFGLNDGLDGAWNKHGGEFKWFSDGVFVPLMYAVAARSKPIQRLVSGGGKLFSKDTAIGIGVPMVLGGLGSLVGNGFDKALKTEDRNPTYATWCQQGGLDSAAVALIGGATYLKSKNLLLGAGAGLAAWTVARGLNALNPHQTPANEFDKSIVAIGKFQKERTSESMEESIDHLREFGNFGRTDVLKNPWDLQHLWEIPGNLHDQFVGRTKLRVNAVPTYPDLTLFAEVFPDSQHCVPGYSGTIAHAVANFAAGERTLKWGAVGVEKLFGDYVGQDTKVDLGGEALKRFITARREIDQCIDYARKHDGQVPEGEVGAKPINAEAEVKMLNELDARVDKGINDILGAHENLDQVINDLKDRMWKGHYDAVNELRADCRERAKYPKLEHPLTPRLQAKLLRDSAMMDLAAAEIEIEGKMKFNNRALGDSHKQVAFMTSPMPKLEVAFGEALDTLTWAKSKMDNDDPAYADLNHIADRAYKLYQKAQQAGLPEVAVMTQYLQRFKDRKLIDISMNYENDAVVRAAIRNKRNPIREQLDEYNNPPQTYTPADKQRDEAAQQEQIQQQEAANQEAGQLQEKNSEMQHVELDYGNRRHDYASAHIEEEINRFRASNNGQLPTLADQKARYDVLLAEFDYLVKSGRLNPDGTVPGSSSSQAPAGQPTAAESQQTSAPQQAPAEEPTATAPQQPQEYQAPAQQPLAYQSPANQPQSYQNPENPLEPTLSPAELKQIMLSRVQQFVRDNGRTPNSNEWKDLAKDLPSHNFKMSTPAPNNSPNYKTWVPQAPVQVIQQAPPDQ